MVALQQTTHLRVVSSPIRFFSNLCFGYSPIHSIPSFGGWARPQRSAFRFELDASRFGLPGLVDCCSFDSLSYLPMSIYRQRILPIDFALGYVIYQTSVAGLSTSK